MPSAARHHFTRFDQVDQRVVVREADAEKRAIPLQPNRWWISFASGVAPCVWIEREVLAAKSSVLYLNTVRPTALQAT